MLTEAQIAAFEQECERQFRGAGLQGRVSWELEAEQFRITLSRKDVGCQVRVSAAAVDRFRGGNAGLVAAVIRTAVRDFDGYEAAERLIEGTRP